MSIEPEEEKEEEEIPPWWLRVLTVVLAGREYERTRDQWGHTHWWK